MFVLGGPAVQMMEGLLTVLGEAKWPAQPFDYQELERYLGHG